MIGNSGAWLPSVYLWLPVIGAGVALCVWLSWLAWAHADEAEEFILFGIFPALAVLALVIGSAFGYYPYNADYHKLQPATGIVKEVDTRFMAASQYVVITYEQGAVVRCDDSRCATVRPGQELRLLCTKEHQFGSPLEADGWGCRWGQR